MKNCNLIDCSSLKVLVKQTVHPRQEEHSYGQGKWKIKLHSNKNEKCNLIDCSSLRVLVKQTVHDLSV